MNRVPVIPLTKKISLPVGGQSINAIIAGNVGSGKTYLIMHCILSLLSQGCICYVADMKGGDGGELYSLIKDNTPDGEDYAINDPEEFEKVLNGLLETVRIRISKTRNSYEIGKTAIELDDDWRTIVLFVDEYSTGIALLKRSADKAKKELGKRIDEKLMTLVSQARQASIGIFFSFQYYTSEVLPKSVEAECTIIGMGNLDQQLAINLFNYSKALPRFDYSLQGAGLIKKPQDNEPMPFRTPDMSKLDFRKEFERVSGKKHLPSDKKTMIIEDNSMFLNWGDRGWVTSVSAKPKS